MTTYVREKPCRKCGGREFYYCNHHCADCAKAHNAKNNQRNSLEYHRQWRENNREYLRFYNRARSLRTW